MNAHANLTAEELTIADLAAAEKMLDSIEWRSDSLRKKKDEFLSDANERSINHAVTWKLVDALEAEQTMYRYGELDAAIRNWIEMDEKPELEAYLFDLRGKYMEDLLRRPWEGRSSSAGSNLVAQAYATSLVKVTELCDTLAVYVEDARDRLSDTLRKAAIEAETAKNTVIAELGGTVLPQAQVYEASTQGAQYQVVEDLFDGKPNGFQIVKCMVQGKAEYLLVEDTGISELGQTLYRTHAYVTPGRSWRQAVEGLRAIYAERC